MSRAQVLGQLADLLVGVDRPHPTRVAIDGIDAAGKTSLADALGPLIMHRGRYVVRFDRRLPSPAR
jgi:uridine kinase